MPTKQNRAPILEILRSSINVKKKTSPEMSSNPYLNLLSQPCREPKFWGVTTAEDEHLWHVEVSKGKRTWFFLSVTPSLAGMNEWTNDPYPREHSWQWVCNRCNGTWFNSQTLKMSNPSNHFAEEQTETPYNTDCKQPEFVKDCCHSRKFLSPAGSGKTIKS